MSNYSEAIKVHSHYSPDDYVNSRPAMNEYMDEIEEIVLALNVGGVGIDSISFTFPRFRVDTLQLIGLVEYE